MRRLYVLILLVLMITSFNIVVLCDDNIVPIYINNTEKNVTNIFKGKNINGRTMIKASAVEINGGAAFRHNENGEIYFERADKKIVMKLNNNIIKINGSSIIMDCTPMLIDGYIYVPLKYLYEALDCEIEWDNELKAVIINTGDIYIGNGQVVFPLNDRNILSNKDVKAIYDDVYTEKYKNTLDKMFSLGWEIKSEKQYVLENFEICDHCPHSIYIFKEWEVLFTDKYNNKKIFIFKNNSSMNDNIKDYLIDNFNEYYKNNYVDKYFNDKGTEKYIDFYFAGQFNNYDKGDESESFRKYINSLSKTENAIDLANFDFNKIYEICPVYASIKIYCQTDDIEDKKNKQLKIDEAYCKAEKMVSEIIKDSDGKANIELLVSNGRDRSFNEVKRYNSFYIKGQLYSKDSSVQVNMSSLTCLVYKDTLYNIY